MRKKKCINKVLDSHRGISLSSWARDENHGDGIKQSFPIFFQVIVRLRHRRFRHREKSLRRRRRTKRRTRTRRRAVPPKRRSRIPRKSRRRMFMRPMPLRLSPPSRLRIVRKTNPPWLVPTSGPCSLAAPKLEGEAKRIHPPSGKYLPFLKM